MLEYNNLDIGEKFLIIIFSKAKTKQTNITQTEQNTLKK